MPNKQGRFWIMQRQIFTHLIHAFVCITIFATIRARVIRTQPTAFNTMAPLAHTFMLKLTKFQTICRAQNFKRHAT